ncbi:hypothetical protein [Streptomyces spongiicola]|uniref:hypothetical protein n=1 Tax=Streptomyces spongiicola TaxID=1690221 RepID=UPI001C0F0F49|nr:hypothetical protein [Streptomyces spongiicola]
MAQLADAACEGAEGFLEVGLNVQKLAAKLTPPLDSVAVRELVTTFAYVLSVMPLGSAQPGAALVPLDGPAIPRALKDSDDEVRSLWLELGGAVTHPVARARCADIVFTLRLANARDAAEKAANAYLDLVGGAFRMTEQSHALLRAWTLARSVNLVPLAQQVASVMFDTARDALARQDNPHVFVELLDALTVPRKKNAQPVDPRVDDLLDRALLTYTDTRIVAQVAKLVRRRAVGDESRIRKASEVEVTAYLNDADRATNAMIVRNHLSEAATRARQLNVPELERVAVARLQSAPPVEWKIIESEIKIPNVLFRSYLRPFERADTWLAALGYWFHADSPSGTLAVNERTAREVFNQSVFSRLATTVMFGDNDLPKRVLGDDDDVFQRELIRVETMNIHLHGLVLADALDLIRTRFGVPSFEDLYGSLVESGVHPDFAKALAKAFILYWVGEFEASAHLAVPKVEAAARALLLELNEPLCRTAVGDGSGKFPGLGVLLDPLTENDFDPDWSRFLATFLLEEGMNVRNLIAHGFMKEVGRETAALGLRAFALLALITSADAVDRDEAVVRAALANPHGASSRSWRQRAVNAVRAAWIELRR